MTNEILCGNASDSLWLTFKGGCRKPLTLKEAYRCTGCGGRFHKECILKHFKLEKKHDWGRHNEREKLIDWLINHPPKATHGTAEWRMGFKDAVWAYKTVMESLK